MKARAQLEEQEVAKFNVQDLLPIVMIFVVAGIGIAFGLDVVEDTQDSLGESACEDNTEFTTYNSTDNMCYNSSALGQAPISPGTASFNATSDTVTGVAKFPAKFPILATVIIAAIIISVLLTYLAYRAR